MGGLSLKRLKRISRWAPKIELVTDISEEDIEKKHLEPCPICGDRGLTKGKNYWCISDPVLLCEEHTKDIRELAKKALDKFNAMKSKKELEQWRETSTDVEKRYLQAVILFGMSQHSDIDKYAKRVACKLWKWVI